MKRIATRACAAAWLLAGTVAAQGGRPPPRVEVAQAVQREVAARRSFVGTVEPARMSVVGSEVEDVVVERLAEEGNRVEAGAPLARLRTRPLEIRLQAARAELGLRRQELAELENGSRSEEIDEARARVGQAQAEVEIRQWKLESAQRLFASNSISEDALKDARLAARVAEQRLKQEQAALALVEAGPRTERVAQARARVDVQQAAVDQLEDELERHTIRAPFAGYVVREHTEVGQWLRRGDSVAEIAALDEVDVVVPVLEDYVGGLRLGMEVPVTVDALPGRSLAGTLQAIVPRADARARTFPVKIRLANPDGEGGPLVKAGMFVRVHFEIGKKKTTTLVPKDALVLGGAQPVVWIVDPETSMARPQPVRTGLAVDGLIEVLADVAPGDAVVVKGNERLRGAQQRVQVLEPGRADGRPPRGDAEDGDASPDRGGR